MSLFKVAPPMPFSEKSLEDIGKEFAAKYAANKPVSHIEKLIAGDYKVCEIGDIAGFISNPAFEYRYLDNEDYHAEKEHKSSSVIKSVLKTEWNYANYAPMGSSAAMNVGTIGHIVIEEYFSNNPLQLSSAPFLEGMLTIDAKRKTTAIVETLTVSQQYFDLYLNTLLDLERKGLGDILRQAMFEVSIFGTGYGSVAQKVRIDTLIHLPNEKFDIAFDAKFLAKIKGFEWTVKDYGYNLSAGMYASIYKEATGRDLVFAFICVDKSNKGLAQIVEIGEATMEEYCTIYRGAIDRINNIGSVAKGYPIKVM